MNHERRSPELGEVADGAAHSRMAEPSGDHDSHARADTDVEVEHADTSDGLGHEQNPEVESIFQATVEEGTLRVHRSLPTLLSTGLVGGFDVSMGVIALLVTEHETGSKLLGALAFTIGFIALTLARSELFTENFLVPVAALIARQARVHEVIRLWLGTCVMNLVGGWIALGLFLVGDPEIGVTANRLTAPLIEQGIGLRSFALAIIGGGVITVMTWMERNCDTQGPQVVAAVIAAFVLASVPLNHVIVNSLTMFAALHAGASFGYAQYFLFALWWGLGNMIGGLVFVTLVRLVQVGRGPIEQARRTPFQRLHPGMPGEAPSD